MRVIAGKARRLLLKTIEGPDTRPTTDRIKETLFNMINTDMPDCCFLDLFSGSGAIGIEALSRGARRAVMIEQNSAAAECIRQNLASTHLDTAATVMNCDALTGLRRLEGKHFSQPKEAEGDCPCFDYVFMDPPYGKGLEEQVLSYLSRSLIINEETVIIIELALDEEFGYLSDMGYDCLREKVYKTNKHIFIRRRESQS